MPGGRPRLEDKRAEVISIRLTRAESATVADAANAWGASISAYIRFAALSHTADTLMAPLLAVSDEPVAADTSKDNKQGARVVPDFFAQYARRFETQHVPIMQMMENAHAEKIAVAHFGPGEFQFWATPEALVGLVLTMPDGRTELWRPHEEGTLMSALLRALEATQA